MRKNKGGLAIVGIVFATLGLAFLFKRGWIPIPEGKNQRNVVQEFNEMLVHG